MEIYDAIVAGNTAVAVRMHFHNWSDCSIVVDRSLAIDIKERIGVGNFQKQNVALNISLLYHLQFYLRIVQTYLRTVQSYLRIVQSYLRTVQTYLRIVQSYLRIVQTYLRIMQIYFSIARVFKSNQ